MLAKKTSKNQLTLPKEAVNSFPDIEYFDVRIEQEGILLVPVRLVPATDSLAVVRRKIKQLNLTPQDIEEAVGWARKNKKRT